MSINKLLKLANKFESKYKYIKEPDLRLGQEQPVWEATIEAIRNFSQFPSEEEIKDEVISFFQERDREYKNNPEAFAIGTSDLTRAHPLKILLSKGFIGGWLEMISNSLFNKHYGPIYDESAAAEYLKNLKSAIIDWINKNIELFDSAHGIAFLKLRSDISLDQYKYYKY